MSNMTFRPLAKGLVVLLVLTMFLTMGCNMVTSLFSGGGGASHDLWSDVPAMDGMTKTDTGLPLAAKLAIQAAFQGAIDYVAYSTDKTPQEVLDFYSTDKMQAAGWNSADAGCVGDTGSDSATGGAVCFYTKETNGKKEALALVSAVDDSTKKTNVFFARIDVSKLETPTPSS